MKKHFLILAIISFVSTLHIHAQGDMYSRLPFYNPGMFNPGATGLESKNFVIADFNSRWHKIDNHPIRFDVGYERTIDKINSSVGVYYYYSQSGVFLNTNTIGISYSYKFSFADDHFLKLGVQLNVIRHEVDFSKFEPVNPGDPTLVNFKLAGTKPDINLGIWYFWNKLSIGASIINVFRPDIIVFDVSVDEQVSMNLPGYLTFLAKYDIKLSNSFDLTPAIYYYNYSNDNLGFDYLDYSVNFSYNKMINLGIIYSPNNYLELTLFAGVKIIKKINIQLSYGFPSSDYRKSGPVIETLASYSIN